MSQTSELPRFFAVECLKVIFQTECPQKEFRVVEILQQFQSKDIKQVLRKHNHDGMSNLLLKTLSMFIELRPVFKKISTAMVSNQIICIVHDAANDAVSIMTMNQVSGLVFCGNLLPFVLTFTKINSQKKSWCH
jgi:hypothetical protein